MDQYKVSYPDINSYVNRQQRNCPVCDKIFMKGAEGVAIEGPAIHFGIQWFCSDTCATFYILQVMDAVLS